MEVEVATMIGEVVRGSCSDLGITWCLGRSLADIREMVWDIIRFARPRFGSAVLVLLVVSVANISFTLVSHNFRRRIWWWVQ